MFLELQRQKGKAKEISRHNIFLLNIPLQQKKKKKKEEETIDVDVD